MYLINQNKMKKIIFFLFLLSTIVVSSCSDEPKMVVNQEHTLESVTYNSQSKTFTLTFSDDKTKTVNAVLDNTSNPPSASYTMTDGTFLYVADASISGIVTINHDVNRVSKFVYDGMSSYYLWSNEMVNKKPTVKDVDPKKYFESVLSSVDKTHGWSWITDDIDELLSGFSGESAAAFGFGITALWFDSSRTRIVGFVRYVYPGTPADLAGLKRGDVITHSNGVILNGTNYSVLFGSNSEVIFTVLDKNFENPRLVTIKPATIKTDPVLYSKVYEDSGKKIGYLFYTNFIEDYNSSLYRVFSEFKAAGVTDLVLDLRYNPGGSISAATYLASLIAPASAVQNKEVFTIMNYNDYINGLFAEQKVDRKDYFGTYNSKFANPLTANLNLNKVYIIAMSSSYSASELITHCLAPYMTVEHIGEKTGGKYTASWTVHAYNNYGGTVQPVYNERSLTTNEKATLKNWAMQPIVGKYTDKNNLDFIATNGLVPDYPIASQEQNTYTWKPIGDTNDYLLAKAISLITGKPYSNSISLLTRSSNAPSLKETSFSNTIDAITKEGVIIDNPKLLPPLK